jgi:hypothetical protein
MSPNLWRVRRLNRITRICLIRETRVQQNFFAERRNGRQGRVASLRVLGVTDGLGVLARSRQGLGTPHPVVPRLVSILPIARAVVPHRRQRRRQVVSPFACNLL